MTSDTLLLRKVGPIREAKVQFGDLTVLVGPQASGKSVLLQFLKLLLDTGPIFRSLKRYGLDWGKDRAAFFDVYFGEGMRSIWSSESRVLWRGAPVDILELARPRKGRAEEKCFFIPAQRVLALSRDGWFRPFADYKPGDPYVVREFSEELRVMMESVMGRGAALFPQEGRLKAEIRSLVSEAVFSGFRLEIDRQGVQKRLVLRGRQDQRLPYMIWSAGQREFVPLLLGLYWLMPPTRVSLRGTIRWAVIEELEMGLHPRAIAVMLVIVLDLLRRGYRVCLSTHSPHVLDLLWALRVFRQHKAGSSNVLRLFEARPSPSMLEVGAAALRSRAKVYYFDGKYGVKDISDLDPGSSDTQEAGWGGLTEFSGRVADEVARVVADSGMG